MADQLLSNDQFKNGFFDRKAVIDAVGRAAAQALAKGGAYVRTRSKSSLKYRSKSSKPGQPPTVWRDDRPGGLARSHVDRKTGETKSRSVSILKEFIFFAWDGGSVVIGPSRSNQILMGSGPRPARGTVPGLLERGGSGPVFEVFRKVRVTRSLGRDTSSGRFTSEPSLVNKWVRANPRERWKHAGLPKRYRQAVYEARPFMLPALMKEVELGNIVGPFRLSMDGRGNSWWSKAA